MSLTSDHSGQKVRREERSRGGGTAGSAPGKVTLASKLPPASGVAIQKKEESLSSGSVRIRSAAEWTMDPWMDATVRGTTPPALMGRDHAAHSMQRGNVQMRGGKEQPADDVHRLAEQGLSGAASQLPFLDRIQHSFGRHDVSGIQAHVGGPAAQASNGIGANAYATGNHVAFRETPDLHTAAHEAAHVVQQRAGISLSGGVGQAGDPYERRADAVADRVVRGESAESLLDPHAGGSSPARAGSVPGDASIQAQAANQASHSNIVQKQDEEPEGTRQVDPWVESMIDFMGVQDRDVIRRIVADRVRIVRFTTAWDTWRYDDGREERVELRGLRGNTDERTRTIRIRAGLPTEQAAATLFHEMNHWGRPPTADRQAYLDEEIDVRIQSEHFAIRHGLPETGPGYRNQDGTVNEERIRQSILSSSHYNPQGRRRIRREYEGEQETHGWHVP